MPCRSLPIVLLGVLLNGCAVYDHDNRHDHYRDYSHYGDEYFYHRYDNSYRQGSYKDNHKLHSTYHYYTPSRSHRDWHAEREAVPRRYNGRYKGRWNDYHHDHHERHSQKQERRDGYSRMMENKRDHYSGRGRYSDWNRHRSYDTESHDHWHERHDRDRWHD